MVITWPNQFSVWKYASTCILIKSRVLEAKSRKMFAYSREMRSFNVFLHFLRFFFFYFSSFLTRKEGREEIPLVKLVQNIIFRYNEFILSRTKTHHILRTLFCKPELNTTVAFFYFCTIVYCCYWHWCRIFRWNKQIQ